MKRTSVRLLRQWRRDALHEIEELEQTKLLKDLRRISANRILIMTQELLDLWMMEEKSERV